MSRRGWQTTVLLTGAVVILLLALFPPWHRPQHERFSVDPLGFHWMQSPPSTSAFAWEVVVDTSTRNNLQLAVAGLTLVGAYVLRPTRSKED